jgi:curved DNA-binding protein CbpA
MEDNKNYYQILEISPSASQEEIREAYIRAKNAYSGDSIAMYSLLSEDDCHEILNNIEEAFTILSDPEKRQQYNQVKGISGHQHSDGLQATGTDQQKPNLSFNSYTDETLHQPSASGQDNIRYQDHQTVSYNNHQSLSKIENTGVSKVDAIRKYRLSFDKDEDFEQQIDNCLEFSGEFLKKIREYKNVTVERLAEMTKVSKNYIYAIEEEDYDKLPAPVYLRGFIYQYAKSLKLNMDFVATSYMKRYQVSKNP